MRREIAVLTGKEHKNVRRDIEKLLHDLGVDVLRFEHIYIDPMNRQQKEYLLDRDHTENLLLGYSAVLRQKVLRRLRELEEQVSNPAIMLNDPAMLRHLLLENVEKVLALEADVKEMQQLAASYEHLTRADGTICITDAAKVFGQRPKDLFSWLQAKRWIYRRAGNGRWVGYQDKIQAGLLDHRLEEVTKSDGSSKIVEQVRVTAKGMARLGEFFSMKEGA